MDPPKILILATHRAATAKVLLLALTLITGLMIGWSFAPSTQQEIVHRPVDVTIGGQTISTMNGRHWPTSTVRYFDNTDTPGRAAQIVSARDSFNNAVDEVTLTRTTQRANADVVISDDAYGSVSWVGLCRNQGIQFRNYGTPWRDFQWNERVDIILNDSNASRYNTDQLATGLITHEMGHCVAGMGHTSAPGRIMQPLLSDLRSNGLSGIDSATADEIDLFWSSTN